MIKGTKFNIINSSLYVMISILAAEEKLKNQIMYQRILTCLTLCVFAIPGYNQVVPDNKVPLHETIEERTAGINGFLPVSSSETLDSVIHFGYKNESAEADITRWIYFNDDQDRLDSVKQHYTDNTIHYTSGYTIRYNYDANDRVSNVNKNSWNSNMEGMAILINEDYQYQEGKAFTRTSNIEWRTLHDTSDVDFQEDYGFDLSGQLAEYTMTVPFEIDPDTAVYTEEYIYDTNGSLALARNNLSESGESISLREMQYQNDYSSADFLNSILLTQRINGEGGWLDAAEVDLFYDDLDRITIQTLTRSSDTLFPAYEKQNYTYDQYDNLIREVRYTSDDAVNYHIADSIMYFHTVTEEQPPANQSGFILFPNPTHSNVHVRSDIDGPSILQVFNVLGQLLISENVENGMADIDLAPYPAGYYLIILKSPQEYYSGKVLKY